MKANIEVGSMLTIDLDELPPEQLEQIIDDNTYDNPEFNLALRMNRSVRYVPKKITTYQVEGGNIIFPRGYLPHLYGEMYHFNYSITLAPAAIPPLAGITLRPYQEKAVSDTLGHEQGIIQAGTGSGKSYMGLQLIHQRQQKTLILVHSKGLATQWASDIKKRMGIDCGLIGGDKNTQADITICMLQTLSKRPELLEELSANYGLVLQDEVHHVGAKSFARVINQLACHYRYGLTATPVRRDGLHKIINRHIGDIIAKVDDKEVHAVGGVVPMKVKAIHTGRSYKNLTSWNDYLKAITDDEIRNQMIVDIAIKASIKAPTLILTDRVAHAEILSELADIEHLLIHGKLPAKVRKERMQAISSHSLTIGTTNLLGEGIDESSWTNLILSTPISSKVKLLQSIGRVCRTHEGKTTGYIADLVDSCGFSHASYKKRLVIYKEKGVIIL